MNSNPGCSRLQVSIHLYIELHSFLSNFSFFQPHFFDINIPLALVVFTFTFGSLCLSLALPLFASSQHIVGTNVD